MRDQSKLIKQLINEFCKDKFVLDNGCGDLVYSIAALEAGAIKVSSVDIKEPARIMTNNRFVFYKADAQQLSFLNESFDIIICIGLIEYINLDKGIEEMKRVLKKDGLIIFQTKDSRGWRHKWYKFKCKLRGKIAPGTPQDYKTLIKKLKDNFMVTYYKETKPRHNFLVVLKKWDTS